MALLTKVVCATHDLAQVVSSSFSFTADKCGSRLDLATDEERLWVAKAILVAVQAMLAVASDTLPYAASIKGAVIVLQDALEELERLGEGGTK